jgi:hypothetical protein
LGSLVIWWAGRVRCERRQNFCRPRDGVPDRAGAVEDRSAGAALEAEAEIKLCAPCLRRTRLDFASTEPAS